MVAQRTVRSVNGNAEQSATQDGSVSSATAAGATTTSAGTGLVPLTGRLSPTRASDFTTCPLLYRFRSIDRLPEPPTRAMAKGTLVHLVLERLFESEQGIRTVPFAHSLISDAWDSLCTQNSDYAHLIDDADRGPWFAEVEQLLTKYFGMEDPQSVEPHRRESPVEFQVTDELLLRGLVDRIDVDDDGNYIVVDYKTGKAPRPNYEQKAMFQMRFYALVIWRSTGRIPRELRLMYLADGQVLTDSPSEDDLIATQRKLLALWDAIKKSHNVAEFKPRPSALCNWCNFTTLCPAKGGVLPPFPHEPSA